MRKNKKSVIYSLDVRDSKLIETINSLLKSKKFKFVSNMKFNSSFFDPIIDICQAT